MFDNGAYDFAGDDKHKEDVSVKGTQNICDAAIKHKVKQMVHVSTFSAYGNTPPGALNEKSEKQPSDDIYTKTKLAAEELVLDYHAQKGLPVSIVQPSIVYGPFSRPWTINPLKQLSNKYVPLVDGGLGQCNAVYIDDVVDAMILAATKKEAIGEVFLISAAKPITWKEYYGSLESILGRTATVEIKMTRMKNLMSKKTGSNGQKRGAIRELMSLVKNPEALDEVKQIPAVKSAVKSFSSAFPKLYGYSKKRVFGRTDIHSVGDKHEAGRESSSEEIPVKEIAIPDQTRFELWISGTEIKIDKARELLGYEPQYDFATGMEVTEKFIRWANIV